MNIYIYTYTYLDSGHENLRVSKRPNLQRQDMSLMNFSAELNNQKLSISAVDKRSTAIVTPLPGPARHVFQELHGLGNPRTTVNGAL